MAEWGTGPTLCFALCEFVDGRPYFSSCKLYGCIFRALPLMAKGISSRHFIAVPLSHAQELSMEDPCCKLPELGIHHCMLSSFPYKSPFGLFVVQILFAPWLCRQGGRLGWPHTPGLFGFLGAV